MLEDSEDAGQDGSATARKEGSTQGKQELLDQLRGRRKEVERLMAKRRAEREGITVAVSHPLISSHALCARMEFCACMWKDFWRISLVSSWHLDWS